MENDILFLGGLLPKETEKQIREYSIGNIQNAANNLQWELVKGLDIVNGSPVKIINSLYIGSYPKRYKKFKIDTYKFSHDQLLNKSDLNVGFFNFTGIKNISRYLSLKPHVLNWATKNDGKKKIIVAYAMTATFTRILSCVKKINPNVITCLIVPDLPEHMNLSNKKNPIYSVLKKLEIYLIQFDKKYIDSFVVLTEHMRNALEINVPSIVIEGVSTDLFDGIELKKNDNKLKTVVYTGGINEKYGVLSLLAAFVRLNSNNYRLIICGAGDAEKEIIKYTKIDNRVIFKGLIERSEVLEIQKSATVLVNPRPNNEEFTKYSFPSKILEYLSSGTPVLSYKLDGIPTNYFDYIYTISEDYDGLYNSLEYVLSRSEDELRNKGTAGKEFAMNKKNNIVQAGKILDMIDSI